MVERGGESMRTSEGVDLSQALRRARREGLFESLREIYDSFPETECENCARCCFESPGLFFIEYLYQVDQLAREPGPRLELLVREALEELFFSWIEPDRPCLFLEDLRCTQYERRPLACRLFGLVAPADPVQAESEARLAARQEARRLKLLGIEVPEAIVQRSLASCDRVRDRNGNPARVDGDAMAARVARLDEALLPRQVVVEEFCFRSLPERLGAAMLGGEAIETMRIQLLRRAQRGEAVENLIEIIRKQVQLPPALGGKKGGR
ncbi:MAG: YkgJ family cysteine cluster protein [Proteobacteria bacterium]|nr:YkgJ family cysteine cluster protein [Pseudomonadota bacterium]